MGSITVDGKCFEVPTGASVSILGDVVRVGGKVVVGDGQPVTKIVCEGNIESLHCERSVEVKGSVHGSVHAGGSVVCGDVGFHVTASGSVECGHVGGDVRAGGSVDCGAVVGDVEAGGSVSYTR